MTATQRLKSGGLGCLFALPVDDRPEAAICLAEFERRTRKRVQNEVKALMARQAPMLLCAAPSRSMRKHCAAWEQSLVESMG